MTKLLKLCKTFFNVMIESIIEARKAKAAAYAKGHRID